MSVEIQPSERHQLIDGFGAFQGGNAVNQQWWQDLYYDDLGASIFRVDLTPRFVSPYSDFHYYSPWFMGSSVDHILNLEDPDNPGGPEGNWVRTYTGPRDYSRSFGGYNAPIAVMGPDIDENVKYFTYSNNGGWSIALKIHQALTTGRQSAWIYWTFAEQDDNGLVTREALTTRDLGANAPKYVAVKHFFRHIRPNAQRIGAAVSGNSNLKASAYIHDEQGALSIVLINTSPNAVTASVMLPQNLEAGSLDAYTSSENNYWQASTADVQNGSAEINVPGYGVVTLTAAGLTTNLEPVKPAAFQLKHFPNPFREQTTIRYLLPRSERVRLSISNPAGKTVAVLVDEIQEAGTQEAVFRPDHLPPGVYFLHLKVGRQTVLKKLTLIE